MACSEPGFRKIILAGRADLTEQRSTGTPGGSGEGRKGKGHCRQPRGSLLGQMLGACVTQRAMETGTRQEGGGWELSFRRCLGVPSS